MATIVCIDVPEFTEAGRDRILSKTTSVDRLVEVWRVALESVGLDWETETSIDPRKFRVLEPDWLWACEAVMSAKAETTDVGQVNAGLDFVNVGPSCRKA